MAETVIEPSAEAQPLTPAAAGETPGDPNFASAFNLAMDQEREAPPTPQMQDAQFQGAFAKAMEQTRAADLTWQHMGEQAWRTALTTLLPIYPVTRCSQPSGHCWKIPPSP